MTEQCGDIPDDADEYNRDERIETIYQGWGAREMAERIVDLEDELGADVDGICTGMHADVAEAQAEVERLASLVGYWEHRAAESCEEVDDLRTELEEACQQRAYQREEDAGRIANLRAEADRLKRDLRVSEAKVGGAALYVDQVNARIAMLENVVTVYDGIHGERDRYHLAWLSARRRAADEANFGMEALDLKAAEIARLTSDRNAWQRGHETAESQLVYERRDNARLRAELADLREAIHEES
jgi:chromosome segregation ATPase